MKNKNGYPIVFTSSATEMSDFRDDPFRAFMGGFPQFFTVIQGYPPIKHDERGAKFAPYGLRKIQAILLKNGFKDEDMIAVHPKYIKKVVGTDTKIIAISAMDPLALAYVDLTYSGFLGMGEATNALEFRKMCFKIKSLKNRHIKLIVGGAGTWQIANNKAMNYLGVDHVIMGESEMGVADTFRKIGKNEQLPPVIKFTSPTEESIIPIQHGVIHGGVELSRGCGRNCQFCSPTMRNRRDIPVDQVLNEVEVNVRAGNRMITLISEDILIYGCKSPKFIPNEDAICNLAKGIAKFGEIKYIQPVHISLACVSAAPTIIPKLTEIFWDKSINQIKGRYRIHKRQIMSAETGIETGSPRIMEKYMRGKCLPFTPKEWPDIVLQSMGILNDNDWLPLASFLLDMPEETEDDTLKTIELVDDLKGYEVFLMPVLFVPLGDCILRNERKADWSKVTDASRELFLRCWENNVYTYKDDYIKGIYKTIIRLLAGGIYLYYYRWREQRKSYKRLIKYISGLTA